MSDFGIFTDEEVAVKNLKESAAALGINPDLIAGAEGTVKYVAKKNCTKCYGRGTLDICLSPSKKRIWSVNKGKRGRGRKEARQASQPMARMVTGVSPGNSLPWNTRQPEPADFKKMNSAKSFCRCIRTIRV